MVRTGLQRDMGGGPNDRIATGYCIAKCHDFCVRSARGLRVALAKHFAGVIAQYAAYAWVWGGQP